MLSKRNKRNRLCRLFSRARVEDARAISSISHDCIITLPGLCRTLEPSHRHEVAKRNLTSRDLDVLETPSEVTYRTAGARV